MTHFGPSVWIRSIHLKVEETLNRAYFQFLFFLQNDVFANNRRRNNEAEHNYEWQLRLYNYNEVVVMVRRIRKTLQFYVNVLC